MEAEHFGFKSDHLTQTSLKNSIGQMYTRVNKDKDKKDLATTQLVFDRITKRALEAFYKNNVIAPLERCISTGKEASVFVSTLLETGTPVAVKIYKTMMMTFKDRDEYIQGEYRVRHRERFTKTNPHKMIKVWAEKEFRNLKRLQTSRIRCPVPFALKENILVMEFIGGNKVNAPIFKEKLEGASTEEASRLYVKLLELIRDMFIKAGIVHGDLSEYNVLYHNDHLYIIDVSQSMEINHPLALDFLRRDL